MQDNGNSTMYPWNNERPFNSYAEYFKRTFGQRVQKVTINAGFSCPNRDGLISTGGCTYCDNAAFNPSYCKMEKSITQQINEGIEFHLNRYRRAKKYLAYFQAYSNTYAPLHVLQERYNEALQHPLIAGVVIGTRPDCMDEEKLAYFAQLSKKYYVIIEYGIESCNEDTLLHINRGHSFACARQMVHATHRAGIHTGAHFIFGLPHETPDMWMQWADIISEMPLDTVKFHQLQIIKNTRMAEEYALHPEYFHHFEFAEYVDFMVHFLEHLHPDIVVERFAGEVPPRFLDGNPWGLIRNDQILVTIEQELIHRHTFQGRLWQPHT